MRFYAHKMAHCVIIIPFPPVYEPVHTGKTSILQRAIGQHGIGFETYNGKRFQPRAYFVALAAGLRLSRSAEEKALLALSGNWLSNSVTSTPV